MNTRTMNSSDLKKQKARHIVSGFFYVFDLWYFGIRPFPALVPFLIVCKERNERCFALQNESACLN
jgi:hypothetical protein